MTFGSFDSSFDSSFDTVAATPSPSPPMTSFGTTSADIDAYVHLPVPPWSIVAGPYKVESLSYRLSMQARPSVQFSVAAQDINPSYRRVGWVWGLAVGTLPYWAGFVRREVWPLWDDDAEISLVGLSDGLLSGEPPRGVNYERPLGAIVRDLLAGTHVEAGDIEAGPRLDVEERAESPGDFIWIAAKRTSLYVRERPIITEGSRLRWLLDLGTFDGRTDGDIGRQDIVDGRFERDRPVDSVTVWGSGIDFHSRPRASVTLNPRGSDDLQPTQPQRERIQERIVGPASTTWRALIEERITTPEPIARERFRESLEAVDRIALRMSMTAAPAQGIHLGRCYRLNVAQWADVLALDTRVQVAELSVQAATNELDLVMRVLA